ncbi:MAG: ATP-binding cassette domain-containing protein [Microbacterium sp.]|uniref:sulfate/molybdate ABC transporter ATP-binding protein n=1 Tax=Microbacterium sp. TaxID=51671 RepID=UPI001DCFECE4|nr:ATP-binding cassette domain-containing protein [Microbacterium sp.]MBW8761443.1 ATP-binding cassette domain-containing protein [Microbacterium sp.]
MSLDIDITARAGAFRVEAAFTVAPGEVLAVLGPNGAGKSTLLAAIAGHRPHASGAISLNGATIAAAMPPERRRIGLLGQRAMLFPHLSALENVAFGPRAQGLPPAEARRRALAHLDEVGLSDVSRHRPAELSGGQQQRVALARALAAQPLALLLDEPFASLDAETGTQARRLVAQLREHLAIPIVLVTHDPLDAVMLAARTVVVDEGRIVQQGVTADVLGHPRSRFAAAITGVNLVTGTGDAAGALMADGGLRFLGHGDVLVDGEAGSAVFSPASVRVLPDGDPMSENSWRGTVSIMEAVAGGIRVFTAEHPQLAVDCPSGAAAALGIRPGATVAFRVDPADVSVRREG